MIQVLHRAFDILELCAQKKEGTLTLSEIADKFELNHATCANIMKTLVKRNYIEQVGYKKGYRLGSMAYQLTGNFSFRKELVQLAKKPVQEFVEELNETCLLAILRKTDLKRVVLYENQSSHELSVKTNTEKDAYNSSTGQLLLAYLTEKEMDAIVDKFGLPNQLFWPATDTCEKLHQTLSKIRKQGFVIQKTSNHVVGIAVPVYKEGAVVASLSVYLPEIRYQGALKEIVINRLQQVAEQISSSLTDISRK